MANVSREVDVLQRLTRDLLAVAMTSVGQTTDVSMPQMRLLFAVGDAGSMSCGALARELGVGGSSVTRLADRLVASGHLDRRPGADNRSLVLLSLTEAGQSTIDGVLASRARVLRDALARLDDTTRTGLLTGADALHDALSPRSTETAGR
ncbi:MarR family transcriptional regulator [Gordonia sp. DT30]|uniref:MarR family transcriptional regulator n=1 Tax=unclassified Gordonia (in: high G+C Gram-positive bacteria) TaxID=2657482 RepID=UPI003CF926BA